MMLSEPSVLISQQLNNKYFNCQFFAQSYATELSFELVLILQKIRSQVLDRIRRSKTANTQSK